MVSRVRVVAMQTTYSLTELKRMRIGRPLNMVIMGLLMDLTNDDYPPNISQSSLPKRVTLCSNQLLALGDQAQLEYPNSHGDCLS